MHAARRLLGPVVVAVFALGLVSRRPRARRVGVRHALPRVPVDRGDRGLQALDGRAPGGQEPGPARHHPIRAGLPGGAPGGAAGAGPRRLRRRGGGGGRRIGRRARGLDGDRRRQASPSIPSGTAPGPTPAPVASPASASPIAQRGRHRRRRGVERARPADRPGGRMLALAPAAIWWTVTTLRGGGSRPRWLGRTRARRGPRAGRRDAARVRRLAAPRSLTALLRPLE